MAYVIFPRSIVDPTGQDKRERSAIAQMGRRFEGIRKEVQSLLSGIPVKKKTISVNFGRYATNAEELIRYEFEIDTIGRELVSQEIGEIVDRWLEVAANDQQTNWFLQAAVVPAYQQGTALAFANLSAQSGVYKATRQSLLDLVGSEPYRTRLGYIRGRSFEQMQGLGASAKEAMRTALLDGMAQGLNPRDVAKNIDAATDAGITRARRIARTEITTANRRARIEEAEQTAVDLGLNIRMMQLSALSATTRATHAARHGRIFTFEQARVWMSTSPNMINCKCTFVEVMVDENGKPIVPGIQERAAQVKERSGYDKKEGA